MKEEMGRNLAKCALSYTAQKGKMKQVDVAFEIHGLNRKDRIRIGRDIGPRRYRPSDDSKQHPLWMVERIMVVQEWGG